MLCLSFVHADNRIPAPHIVAARAYRVTGGPPGTGALPALFAAAASSSMASAAGLSSSNQLSPSTAAPAFGCASSTSSVAHSGPTTALTPPTATLTPLSSTEKTPLYRLAKLLNQTRIGGSVSGPSTMMLKDDAPRRLSWER